MDYRIGNVYHIPKTVKIKWWEKIIIPLLAKKESMRVGNRKFDYYFWDGKIYWWKETIIK